MNAACLTPFSGTLIPTLSSRIRFKYDFKSSGAVTSFEFAMSQAQHPTSSFVSPRVEAGLLFLVLAVAATLRFTMLDSVPPGLWFDEALNLQDAVAAANGGGLKLIYPEVFPREPMFETLLVGVTMLGTPEVWKYRATSALVGLLTVLALWWMVRLWHGPEAALLSASALAALRWHVIFSRLIFRTLILPLWLCLILAAAHAVCTKPSLGRSILLGALVAGGFYTYLAWYFVLPGVMVLAIWAHGPFWRDKHLRRCAMCCLAAILFFVAPLSRHYKKHPEHLLARAEAVSATPLDDPTRALREYAKNLGQALGMFHWKGDHVPKHNLPRAPALHFHEGILFLAGLACFVLRARHGDAFAYAMLAWLALGVAPTIFTKTDSPNFLRTLVATPAIAAIIAAGILVCRDFLTRKSGLRPTSSSLIVLLLATLGISGTLTGFQVLREWPARTDVWESFNGPEAQLGRAAATTPAGTTFWIQSTIGGHRSFQFISRPKPWESLSDIKTFANFDFLRAEGGNAGPRRIVATAQNGLLPVLERLAPAGEIIEEYRRPDGGVWAVLYEIGPDALPEPARVTEAERAYLAGRGVGTTQ